MTGRPIPLSPAIAEALAVLEDEPRPGAEDPFDIESSVWMEQHEMDDHDEED